MTGFASGGGDLRGLRVGNDGGSLRGLRVRNDGGSLGGLCVGDGGGGRAGDGFAGGGEVLVEGEGLAEAGDGGGVGRLRQ